ncbi:MAG: CHASE domain-containing protein [Piscirickettsiaceae bacterium]|nr:CHASE domain-containing protein [Piscirickettsiaceae bacterium]
MQDEIEGLLIAKKRTEYYPVYYVEPLKDNVTALGFDLGSNITRREICNGPMKLEGFIA